MQWFLVREVDVQWGDVLYNQLYSEDILFKYSAEYIESV